MAATQTVLSAQPTPEVARRAWPRWLALGVAMIVVAGASIAWSDGGAQLLLGALGVFLAVRGGVLLRTAPALDGELAGRARTLGSVALVAGVAALVVALLSAGAAAGVLLVGVPVVLLGGALALLTGGGQTLRGAPALLVGAVVVAGVGLVIGTGIGQDWSRAADAATVVAAVLLAVMAVPVLISAVNLRAVAAQPAPAPAGGGCGGCACGAGGCGA